MVTPEQKRKNQQYILDHLEEYVIDKNGNFVNVVDHDIYGKEEGYFCIGKEAVSNWKLLSYEISENILRNKEDWELFFFLPGNLHSFPEGCRNKITGFTIITANLRSEDYSYLFGEFGFRQGPYKNFDKEKEQWKIWREAILKKNSPDSSQPQQSEQDQKEVEELKKKLEEQRKKAEEQDQNNPPLNQHKQDQPTEPTNKDNSPPPPTQENNNLPSSTEIQNNYNSDNNPNLTNPEQKEQANELLKLIITAELLIKETKFDSETLSKLTKEKEESTTSYQTLNKEGRIDKVINALESIQKSQEDKNNLVAEDNKNPPISLSTKIFLGTAIIVGSLILGIVVMQIIKRKKIKR